MLDNVRQQPCDPPVTPKIDRLAHRRLDRLLIGTDIRLQEWGHYGAPAYAAHGYPLRLAGDTSPEAAHRDDSAPWPADVMETEEALRRLHWTQRAAAMAWYCAPTVPPSQRAAVYRQLVKFKLAGLDPESAAAQRVSLGPDAFRRNLDRARWSLRLFLDPYGPEVTPPPAPEPKPFGYYTVAAIRARRDLGQR
jgi:hypothetical protein